MEEQTSEEVVFRQVPTHVQQLGQSNSNIAPGIKTILKKFNVKPAEPVPNSQSHETYDHVDNKTIDPHDVLQDHFEAFEYDPFQNPIFIEETQIKGFKRYSIPALRYFLLFLIGLCTGLSATIIEICIHKLTDIKFENLKKLMSSYYENYYVLIPILTWMAFNVLFAGAAAALVLKFSHVAMGSGIPQVKCYLNGINVPKLMRVGAGLVKGAGVIFAVVGGLAIGKEGPMIHIGSVIAAGLSQGRFTYCGQSLKYFRVFRNDIEKRDFVSAGAAAGVSAAFGAPVGGLLFALEEGSSFVSPIITWRILFSSMISMFTLAVGRSVLHGTPFKFTLGGLTSFGKLNFMEVYNVSELILFVLMGFVGGLLGALFIKANTIISKFRKKYVLHWYSRLMEVLVIACLSASVGYCLIWTIRDCKELSDTTATFSIKAMCADNEFNSISTLFFTTPEMAVRNLLHDPTFTYNWSTLIIFFPVYMAIACITFGIFIPSGLFIPGLLVGAAWGRIFGTGLYYLAPKIFTDPSKFALIGAAAQLGGIVRMTVSLTVILMEATGSVLIGLPILLTLIVAKYVGDFFTEGIYDVHIGLNGMALMPWEPDSLAVSIRAFNVMTSPVVCLRPVMKVSELVEAISSKYHHGFPIVEGDINDGQFVYGSLIGLIPAEHIGLMLKNKIFILEDDTTENYLTINDYDNAYPRYPNLKDAVKGLAREDMNKRIDFRPYMNHAPYSIVETMTMQRIFHMFRSLGLRHLPVVDINNQVRGIITRKDLCRYRFATSGPNVHVEEMMFSRQLANN